ncbi:hypothetical protein MKC74_22290 [[Clostridium] innocuum]|uniref:hypothetical protein n=1 Tax=Clostridium TaxID=1485 RepID=UPI0001E69CDB|nr:hypothetical protein [[Clostridium] innocuum]EFP63281.1 hypothetical protein HMPREF0983_00135 [Erysipelotrichaceae bacterium 3_1_53]MCR0158812.1 hypothetical protein [[Clostridium] innocuum]MCR0348276.1 hypothetical protein [[Clostridium] innocuum]
MKAVTVMNDNEVLLERIKGQIRIWEAYYNETGHYREDTIFLDTGDTAVYDPYVSECMRFKVAPKSYYGEEAYQAWLEDMRAYLGGDECGKKNT